MKRILTLTLLFVSFLAAAQTEGSYFRVTTVVDVFFSNDTLNVITTDSTFRDTIPVTVGPAGLSAYEIWLDEGNSGSIADFLNSLIGPPGATGDPGAPGSDGLSAYQIWLNEGNSGTEADFLNSLIGAPGATGDPGAPGSDGLSAYQIWLNAGNSGTEADFLASLVGPQGQPGTSGTTTTTITPDIFYAPIDEVGFNVSGANGTPLEWSTATTTSPTYSQSGSNNINFSVATSGYYRLVADVSFLSFPTGSSTWRIEAEIELTTSTGTPVDGMSEFANGNYISGSGQFRTGYRLSGVPFLTAGTNYQIRVTALSGHSVSSPVLHGGLSLQAETFTVDLPAGPQGDPGDPGPASTVPGPPGPAGNDGFGIQLIGTVADSASLNPAYTGNVGDVFIADDTRNGFAWDGSNWINVGQIKGDDGLSAYQVWLANGNSGTEADFLLSLRGQDGAPGQAGPTQDLLAFIATKNNAGFVTPETYTTLTGWDEDETNSAYSFNATTGELTFDSSGLYFVIVDLFPDPTVGNNRVQLKGKIQEDKGSGFQDVPSLEWGNYSARNGQQDEGGLSAPFLRRYDVGDVIRIQVERTGSDADFGEDRARLYVARMEALADGLDGLSAYEIWLNEGNTGTEADFLASLEGTPGTNGSNGDDGRDGEKWFLGSGIPSAGLGEDGDLYLQTDVTAPGDVYEKQSGNWVFQYTLELNGVGPAGNGISAVNYNESTGVLTLDFTAGGSFSTPDIRGGEGEAGNGISSVDYNETTGVLTLNFTAGGSFSTPDIRGEQGEPGEQGPPGPDWPDGTTFGTTSNTTFTVASGSVYNLSNSGSSQLTVNFNGVNLIDGQSIVINCTKSGTGNILLGSVGEGITYEGSTAALYTTSGTKTFIAVKAAGRLYISSSPFLD